MVEEMSVARRATMFQTHGIYLWKKMQKGIEQGMDTH